MAVRSSGSEPDESDRAAKTHPKRSRAILANAIVFHVPRTTSNSAAIGIICESGMEYPKP
uniref:Uncharacterized protein n=1 Tax=Pristionchus pacificus TaxID=54126 RepID=A0A2A6C5T9_PRIPA|eukprot:PDM73524.1 hypothetical protein PRIPAC_40880 [Pristionchus pacificus]